MFSGWLICMAESGPDGLRRVALHLSTRVPAVNIIGTNIMVLADLKRN